MFRKACIEDLAKVYKISEKRMREERGNVKIVLIDNEHVNAAADSLKKAGYVNVTPLPNLTAIEEVAPFDIVLIDVKGIGARYLKGSRSASLEGIAVAREIKRLYPLKKVIVFSAMLNEYKDHFVLHGVVDDVFAKDEDITVRNQKIDRCIRERIDPVEQWKRYRIALLENGVSIYKVAGLENEYVDAIMGRKTVSENDVKKIIGTTTTLVEIVKGIVEIIGIAAC